MSPPGESPTLSLGTRPPPPQTCAPRLSSQHPPTPDAPGTHSGSWVPPSLLRPRPLFLVGLGAPGARPHPSPPGPVPRPDLLRALEADSALGGSEPAVQAAAEGQGVQRSRGWRRRRGRRRGSDPRLLVAGQAPGPRLRPVVLLFVAVAVPGRAADEGRPAAAASPAPPGLRLGPGPPPARQHQQLQLVQEHAEPRLEHRPGAGGREAACKGGSRAAGGRERTGPGRGRALESRARLGSSGPESAVHGCHSRGSGACGAERAGGPGAAGRAAMVGAGGGEGGSRCRAPRVRVWSGPGPWGYAPQSFCGGAAPHRGPAGSSPAPVPGSDSARPVRSAVANGGSFRRRRRRRPPRSGGRAGGAGAGEPVRDGGRGGAGSGRGEVAAAAHPRPAPHEQVSPEAGASVRARERVEGGEWPRRGGCARG